MRCRSFALVALLASCGGPPERVSDNGWREAAQEQEVAVSFVPGSATLLPADAARVGALRAQITPGDGVRLTADSALAQRRATTVAELLGSYVGIAVPPGGAPLGPDTGVLQIRETRVVANACQRAGEPVGRNIWPGADDDRQRLMPPGCAVNAALQAQVADQQDLVRGRPLQPGASGPFVQAIERYYQRNDPQRAETRTETQRDQDMLTGGQSALSRFPRGLPQAVPPGVAAPDQAPPQLTNPLLER
jgi:hypothetical protein